MKFQINVLMSHVNEINKTCFLKVLEWYFLADLHLGKNDKGFNDHCRFLRANFISFASVLQRDDCDDD